LSLFGERPQGTWFDEYLGHLTPEEVARHMNQTEIVVESSDFQGFGLPGLEALACGAILVSRPNKGIDEYGIDGKNCLITEDLVDGIVRASHLEVTQQAGMLDAALQTAARFNWSDICDAWQKWVESVTLGA
jgi:glycosyltransferase involved in cell wall biosynthesis